MTTSELLKFRLEMASRIFASIISTISDKKDAPTIADVALAGADLLISRDKEYATHLAKQIQLIDDLSKAAIALPVLANLKGRARELIIDYEKNG